MFDLATRRMKPLAGSATLLLASVGLSGCFISFDEAPGVPLDELEINGAAPTEISLSGPDDLILTIGETLAITVDADAQIKDDLRFDLDGDKLGIGRKSDWLDSKGKAVIRVTMPAPSDIDLAGSGSITAPALARRAEISIAGSGGLTIADADAERLEVDIAGSGSLTGTGGTVERLEISTAGSGSVDFARVTADIVEISSAGSSNIDLASDGTVEASVAGSGTINVSGNAKCSLDSVGSGTLNCSPDSTTAAAAPEALDGNTGEAE